MKKLLFLILILVGCQKEEIRVPVGCECNSGVKLDFAKPLNPALPDGPKYNKEHCDCDEECRLKIQQTCQIYVFILPQGGFKRYIYDRNELTN